MDLSRPDPKDPPEVLYEKARRYLALYEEKNAVLDHMKRYFETWTKDRRMKTSGEIVLGEIARAEKQEAERRSR